MRKGFTLIELMIVIAIIAIIAAIAIPNLLESRVTANEAAASASLKSGIFPAQVQFQGGTNLDRDQDGVGEYGTLRMLSGLSYTTNKDVGSLRLLTGAFSTATSYSTPAATINTPAYCDATGYRFAAWAASLTDDTESTTQMLFEGPAGSETQLGATFAAAATATLAAGINANNGEKFWTCVCGPASFGDTGRKVFVIGNDGQVRSPTVLADMSTIYALGAGVAPSNGLPATAQILANISTVNLLNAVAVAGNTLTMLDNNPQPRFPINAK